MFSDEEETIYTMQQMKSSSASIATVSSERLTGLPSRRRQRTAALDVKSSSLTQELPNASSTSSTSSTSSSSPSVSRLRHTTATGYCYFARYLRFSSLLLLILGCFLMATSIPLWHILSGLDNNNDAYNNETTTLLFLPDTKKNYPTKDFSSSNITKNTKYILYYTSFWNTIDLNFGIGRQPFIDHNCPINDCVALARNYNDTDNHPSFFNSSNLKKEEAYYGQYDAVLFSAQANDIVYASDFVSTVNAWRKSNQRFVFVMMESQAYNIHDMTYIDNSFFNWTMTFQWHSDIPRPYGWFRLKAKQEQQESQSQGNQLRLQEQEQQSTFSSITMNNVVPSTDFYYATKPNRWIAYDEKHFMEHILPNKSSNFHALAKRRGKVAWIVSNCHTNSMREGYVYQLKKYIDVDVFGKCHHIMENVGSKFSGNNNGNSHRIYHQTSASTCNESYSIFTDDNCTQYIKNHYKFYLAFENELCNDYVTEKFFRRIDTAIVLTFGQANYSDIAPPHSYINIFDFPSPKSLADYLHQLDNNDTEYLSYFWWKDYYEVQHPYQTRASTGTSTMMNAVGTPVTTITGTSSSPTASFIKEEGRR